MRAYNIVITNPSTGAIIRPASFSGVTLPGTYSSMIGTQPIPAALNIELDIPVFNYATPMGRGWVRVWGISIQEISQANNLVGNNIAVYAGMQKGLPLANPAQYGLIAQGQIFQALGNWEGLDQTLDLFVYPNVGTAAAPKNLVLNWAKGTPLGPAIQNALSTAYPGLTVQVNVNPSIVQGNTDTGPFPSLDKFAQHVRERSRAIIGGSTYQGVGISIAGSTIKVYDFGVAPPSGVTPTVIAFQDLIGQPTWIDAPFLSFKTVMRHDINVGDYIQMPKALATTTPGSLAGSPVSSPRTTSVFQGLFQVQIVRHLGNFRQPSAESWVTVFNAYPVPSTS